MDMDSSASTGAKCKISMLWNWYNVDACFISSQWHIRSVSAYAGTIVALFFLVILLEGFRRMAREYDRKIVRDWSNAVALTNSTDKLSGVQKPFRPSILQQFIRSFFYFVQFGAGYILMLMAMYYNGGIILAIFFGAWAGHFLTAWDTVGDHAVISKDCCS